MPTERSIAWKSGRLTINFKGLMFIATLANGESQFSSTTIIPFDISLM